MLPNRSIPSATTIPVLTYPDVRAGVSWLSETFGFVERLQIGEYHRSQMKVGQDDPASPSSGSSARPAVLL